MQILVEERVEQAFRHLQPAGADKVRSPKFISLLLQLMGMLVQNVLALLFNVHQIIRENGR
jgi:hypothetical protein